MYLWKYWRESRIFFVSTVLCTCLLLWFLLVSHLEVAMGNRSLSLAQFPPMLSVAVAIQSFSIASIAWVFGSYGIGHDLGERSGSYLFSRPGSRGYFVWRDWGFGMAQLFLIIALLSAVMAVIFHKLILAAGDPLHGSILLGHQSVPLIVVVLLTFTTGLLVAALVFSVTYFSTVLVKNSKGVILGVGLLIGYVVLKGIVEHRWPGIELPSLALNPFGTGPFADGLSDHLGLSIALRAATALLFPFAAQFLLEKRDID